MRLVEVSDVFIDNFKASGLSHIGIDVSELQARNPALIIVRLPPTGPHRATGRGTPASGPSSTGSPGCLSICGHRGLRSNDQSGHHLHGRSVAGRPAPSPPSPPSATGSVTGRGQLVELAQSENVINHLGDMFVDCQLGVEPETARATGTGGGRPRACTAAPVENRLARHLGRRRRRNGAGSGPGHRPPRARHRPPFRRRSRPRRAQPRRAGRGDRRRGRPRSRCSTSFTPSRTRASGRPAARRRSSCRPIPNYRRDGWLRPLVSDDVGTHLHPGLAFVGIPQVWRRGSPTLGQDNEYVYKDLLGASDEEFDRYRQDNMLATDYLAPDGTPY